VGVPSLPVQRFDAAEVAAAADFALLAVPHGTAQELTAELLSAGVRVVDFSADHRFDDPAVYAEIYGHAHARPETLARTVYGLPELNRAAIAKAAVVGAAGCYPTSVILAARPALEADLLATREIIADCKSGVSGAGRTANAGTHFPETSEGLHAYKTLAHRHAPEMARALDGIKVRFVPHLVPMNRGILSTVYLRLKPGTTLDQARAVYAARYADEPFVHLLAPGEHPDPRHVRGTNRCHLGLFLDDDLLVVQSAIDNLCKGAAGQAIQCLNLMAGLPETAGLAHTALFP
jgi:N-acetyl-gamma-glutamyl-phosphate reductase